MIAIADETMMGMMQIKQEIEENQRRDMYNANDATACYHSMGR